MAEKLPQEGSSLQEDVEPAEVLDTNESEVSPGSYLEGWRFYGTIFGLYLGLFLGAIEISIVGTVLVAITDDLGAFGQSTWVVTAYLLTYTGFLIIWAQFSDVLGRKAFVILAVVIFIAFSGACGGAQTATQLFVFRALQGIGGAGMYNMAMVIIAEATRPEDFPKYVALVAGVTAVAFAIGPLIGGAIAKEGEWRWVFWLNIPLGSVALFADAISIPNLFPYHKHPETRSKFTFSSLRRLDFLGAFIFLGVSIPLVASLQEANVSYSWNSGVVIAPLVLSGISLIAFTIWGRFLHKNLTKIVPVLSWTFAKRRSMALFATSFLIGGPFTAAIIQIPQRFQTVNGLNPYDAGIRLLPCIVMVPVGAVFGALLAGKLKIKHPYTLLGGTALQLIGAICFALMESSTDIKPSQYGFQIIFGLGSGISNTVSITSIPSIVAKSDVPAALAANSQFRYLGSAVGLGVVTSVLNSKLRPELSSFLSPEQVSAVLRSAEIIKTLPEAQKFQVVNTLANGYTLQWKVVLALICAQVPTSLMML